MSGGKDDVAYSSMQPINAEDTKAGEETEDEGREIDLPEDIYGATMYSIIFDFWDILSPHDEGDDLHTSMNILRLIFINIVLMTNYALQGGMLYWIYVYVVKPAVHSTQSVYQKYHAEIFDDDGNYIQEKWDGWHGGDKEALCGIAFSSYWFMFAILCLWCYTMLVEVRKTQRLQKDIKAVEDTNKVDEMVDTKTCEYPRIVKLTKWIDWLIYLVIIVPKALISISLIVIGAVWLMATDSFADLILNAVALEFVVNIDNLLFEAAMPVTVVEKMAETKFYVAKSPETPQQIKDKVVGGYYRSMIYFFGVWVFVALLMSYGQNIPYIGVLPKYAHDAACPSYQERISSRVCMQGEECFPFGG